MTSALGPKQAKLDVWSEVADLRVNHIAGAVIDRDGERGGRCLLGSEDVIPVTPELLIWEKLDVQATLLLDGGKGGKGVVEGTNTAGALGNIGVGDRVRGFLHEPIIARREIRECDRGRAST